MKITTRESRLIREIPIREARVKCCGEYHQIYVMGNGRIRLPNHSKEDLENIETIQDLAESADSGSFRCLEVLRWWQLIFQGSNRTPSIDRFRGSDIYRKAMTTKSRTTGDHYLRGETAAALIEQLPKPLRSWAEQEWEERNHRARQRQAESHPFPKSGRYLRLGHWERSRAVRAFYEERYIAWGVGMEVTRGNVIYRVLQETKMRPPLFIRGKVAVPVQIDTYAGIHKILPITRVVMRLYEPRRGDDRKQVHSKYPDEDYALILGKLYPWEDLKKMLQLDLVLSNPVNNERPTIGERNEHE